MSLPLDISQLPGEVQREFLECRHTKEVAALAMAEQRQAAVGARTRAAGDRKSIEGLGAPVAEIHPTSFHYWGRRLGYACWHDRAFVKEYLRDVPAARVKAGGTRVQIGFAPVADFKFQSADFRAATQPAKAGTTNPKFRKSYGVLP